jgi:hypothetical protein
VDSHRRTGRATEALGHPDVVGVGVRDQDRVDIRERAADSRQTGHQERPLAREARVHHGQLPGLLDQVDIDDVLVDPLDPIGDPHFESIGGRCRGRGDRRRSRLHFHSR